MFLPSTGTNFAIICPADCVTFLTLHPINWPSHLITAEEARTCPVVQKPVIYPAVALQQAKHLVFRIHKSNIYSSLKAKPTTGIKKKTA